MSRKLLVNDGRGEREMLLIGTMGVGRDPRCDISDANPLLSRHHAEFEATQSEVRVRDLESRNGILVNGARAKETVLRPGDVVTIGHLTIKYIEDVAVVASPAKAPAGDDDATVLVSRRPGSASPVSAAPPPPKAPPKADEDEDGTRMMAPPVRQQPSASAPAAREAAPESGTMVFTPPLRTAAAARSAPAPRSAAPSVAPASLRQARTSMPGEPRARKGRIAKTSWAGRVLFSVLGLATAVFIVTAVPLMLFQGRVVEAIATARATALVNWLAADAASHLSAGESLSSAADAVAREPGVVTAVILNSQGQVLSPASRATEKFDMLPGLQEPASNIFRARSAVHDGLIEIARPIGTAQRPRAGVAWVTFRSSVPAEAGSIMFVLGPALFVALAGGLIVSTMISRMTTRSLVAFNEDIDLAVTGQVAEVRDTLGAKPLQDLANTVNYLIARLKNSTDARSANPREPGSSSLADITLDRDRRGSSASGNTRPRSARIEASSQFRVTSASPECAELIGVRPDALVGAHLIDALPDQHLVDAVFKCISALAESGEQSAIVSDGRAERIELRISRKGKDLPITIDLRVVEGAQA